MRPCVGHNCFGTSDWRLTPICFGFRTLHLVAAHWIRRQPFKPRQELLKIPVGDGPIGCEIGCRIRQHPGRRFSFRRGPEGRTCREQLFDLICNTIHVVTLAGRQDKGCPTVQTSIA